MTNYTEDTMDKLEEIIERAFPCELYSCQALPSNHLTECGCACHRRPRCRRAVREALRLVTELCDRYDTAAFIDEDWLIDQIRALAAPLEDK